MELVSPEKSLRSAVLGDKARAWLRAVDIEAGTHGGRRNGPCVCFFLVLRRRRRFPLLLGNAELSRGFNFDRHHRGAGDASAYRRRVRSVGRHDGRSVGHGRRLCDRIPRWAAVGGLACRRCLGGFHRIGQRVRRCSDWHSIVLGHARDDVHPQGRRAGRSRCSCSTPPISIE